MSVHQRNNVTNFITTATQTHHMEKSCYNSGVMTIWIVSNINSLHQLHQFEIVGNM